MGKIKVFLDTDVIVSALLSSKGASFKILNNSTIVRIITTVIKEEVLEVASRLNLPAPNQTIEKLQVMNITLDKARIVQQYFPYVLDHEDSHVIAGAKKAKVRFLLTHNLKHYKTDKIKKDFDILIMKPGTFLQFLRNN